jgi:hypothetical protein
MCPELRSWLPVSDREISVLTGGLGGPGYGEVESECLDLPEVGARLAVGVGAVLVAAVAGIGEPGGGVGQQVRAQYAHGGMSSGMISLDTWRQRLIPILVEQARMLLDARSR